MSFERWKQACAAESVAEQQLYIISPPHMMHPAVQPYSAAAAEHFMSLLIRRLEAFHSTLGKFSYSF